MLPKYARRMIAGLVLAVGAVASAATPQGDAQAPRGIENAQLELRTVKGDLATAVRAAAGTAGVVWVGYSAPAVRADGGMCCYEENDEADKVCGVCRLGRRGSYMEQVGSGHDDNVVLEGDPELRVLVRVENGETSRIRAFSSACVIDAGGARVVWLSGVTGVASVDWLAGIVESRTRTARRSDHLTEGALSSLAMHAGSEALGRLEGWATGRHPRKLREQAIFWLGAARGEEAWQTLVDLVSAASDAQIRDRAVFAAYVAQQPGSVELLIGAAREDASNKVRRSALMWLAQLAGERAIAAIQEALDDPDTEVKRHAVFALSQLPADRGVPLLIAIVRENPNPEVRKQALFWLGQTGDERALALIEELLLGA